MLFHIEYRLFETRTCVLYFFQIGSILDGWMDGWMSGWMDRGGKEEVRKADLFPLSILFKHVFIYIYTHVFNICIHVFDMYTYKQIASLFLLIYKLHC